MTVANRFVALLVVLVVPLAALIARLSQLRLVEFKYDEAKVAQLADMLVHARRIPETSIQTSAGIQNSPLAVYMLAPAAAASWRPEVLTGYVALLNVAAVVLAALMVSRFWGVRAGVLCGLLYAVSPVAVQYSRKIWAPELMPVLSVVCLLCLLLVFQEGRAWFLVPAAAAWSALVQLHQTAIWLAPLFIIASLVGWRRVRVKPLLGAVTAGLLVAFPYLSYEATHGWSDAVALLAIAGKPAHLSALPWWYSWTLASGWGLESFLVPPDHVLDSNTTTRDWLDVLTLCLLAVGCVRLLAVRGKGSEFAVAQRAGGMAALLVGLWAVLPPLGLTRSSLPVFPHYLLYWYPVPFVLMALGIDWLWNFVRSFLPERFAALAFALLVLAILAGDVNRIIAFRSEIVARHGGGEFGAPLGESEAIVADTLRGGSSARRYVADRGDLPAVYAYLDRGGGAAFVEPDLALVLPPVGMAGWYVADHGNYRSTDTLRSLAATSQQEASSAYVLFTVADGSHVPLAVSQHYVTTAGVQMIAWSGPATLTPGASYELTLWWEVTAAGVAPAGELKVFTHLLDAQRKTIAQHDALGYPPRYWVVGERFATFFSLPVPRETPRGDYRLVAGLYTLPGFFGVQISGPQGEKLGTEIPIATLKSA